MAQHEIAPPFYPVHAHSAKRKRGSTEIITKFAARSGFQKINDSARARQPAAGCNQTGQPSAWFKWLQQEAEAGKEERRFLA